MTLDSTAVPTVNSVNPNTGPQGGGTVSTILGTGFTSATGVYYGYTPTSNAELQSAEFTVISDTEIQATSPVSTLPLGNGPVNVVVFNPNGYSAISENATFYYEYVTGDFSVTTVTHVFLNADGTPSAGVVTFTLSDMMTNGTNTYMPTRFEATLDDTGAISQELVSNIDTNTTPPPPWNTRWRVDFHITGASQRVFYIVVPAGGNTVDLFSLIPGYPQVG